MNPIEIEPTEEELDEAIDSCCEEIRIGNLTWDASYVLKKLDPMTYRCLEDDFNLTRYQCEVCEVIHDDWDEAVRCCSDLEVKNFVIFNKEQEKQE